MSVNGKPFKPDPTSYQMTGIPCGNPARYKSRGVIRMTPNHSIPFENQQIGIPGQGTESAAELECQNMLKNQLNSTADYAKKTLNFTTPARGGELMTGTARGFLTLSEFQRVNQGDQESNQMRGLGFTDHQIQHLMAHKGMDEELNRLRKRKAGNLAPHPDFIARGIKEMQEAKVLKDAELEADHEFSSVKTMSRHRAQLESALLQNKQHPLASIYHKKAKYGSKAEPQAEPVSDIVSMIRKYSSTTDGYDSSSGSDSDIKAPSSPPPAPAAASKPTSAAPSLSTPPPPPVVVQPPAPPKPIVLTQRIESLSSDTIMANKATDAEVLELFPNYDKGEPTKVLFLKNLDKTVGVEDLVSLFIRFQEEGGKEKEKEKISFKLLTGRMKGQAFVTFHDEHAAKSALELAHGYKLKDKPLVIQYGKAK